MANMNMESVNMFARSIVFGNIRNMSSIKMLIRKGYLLAGVVMAANMLVVNEVRAMEENNNSLKEPLLTKNKYKLEKNKVSTFLINNENHINFIGTLVLSLANNHFGWWNYDQEIYWKYGCFGLRLVSLVNALFQFEVNLNLIRCIFWMITGAYHFLPVLNKEIVNNEKNIEDFYTANAVWTYKGRNNNMMGSLFLTFFLQGFISIPLTVNISNLNISISLDAIICELIGKILSARIAAKAKNKKKAINDLITEIDNQNNQHS